MLFYKGDVSTSEKYAQEALQLFRELDHLTNVGLQLFWLGKIDVFRCQYAPSHAIQYYKDAIEVLNTAGAHFQVGRVLTDRGDISFAQCDFASAKADYEEAVTILRDCGFGQSELTGYAQLSLGEVAAALYDTPTSVQWLDRARAVFEKNNTKHGMLHCFIVYGDLALHADPPRLEEAESMYAQALSIKLDAGAEEEALCNVKLGYLELLRSRRERALRYFVLASALHRRMDDLKGKTSAMIRLAELYLFDGDSDTALNLFFAAAPIASRRVSRRDLADCFRGIGEVLGSKEHLDEAESLYDGMGDWKGKEKIKQIRMRQ